MSNPKPAGLREVRALVRHKAGESDAWHALDAMLDEVASLDKLIGERNAELVRLATKEEEAHNFIIKAAAEVEEIVARANSSARQIVEEADSTKTAAAKARTAAETELTAARAQAAEIVAAAKAERDRIRAAVANLKEAL